MVGEYRVGSVSEILAQEAGGKGKYDSKLAALFESAGASSSSTVFRTVSVKEEDILGKKGKGGGDGGENEVKKGKKRKKEEIKLKNKDAAGIRVEAKKKVKAEVEGIGGDKKKNKKKGKKVKEEELVEENLEETPKKKKKRKAAVSSPVKEEEEEEEEGGDNEAIDTKKSKKKLKQKKKKVKKGEVKEEVNEDEVQVKKETDDEEDENVTEVADTNVNDNKFKTLAEKNAPKPKDPELEARTVFVGNLPGETQKKELLRMFKKYGKIETVRLRGGAPSKPTQLKKVAINKKELHSDKNTVTGYIRFCSVKGAEKAASQKGLRFKDNHLILDLATGGNKKRDNKLAIFVGNLHLKVMEEDLFQFFEDCGTIDSVRVIRDNATGMGKGFGYVNFDSREAVNKALETKNQQELKGRNVRISKCVKKLKVKKDEKKMKGGGKAAAVPAEKAKSSSGKSKKGKIKNLKASQREIKRAEQFKGKGKVAETLNDYSGDRLAEIGKLKRKSQKPNRGEMHKTKIAKILTGKAPPAPRQSAHIPNPPKQPFKRYFK